MQISEFANKNQESDVKLFDGLDELTKFIKENFNEYKVDKSMKKKKKIADVKNQVKDLKGKLKDVNNALDKQEQYSIRNCLLLNELDKRKK